MGDVFGFCSHASCGKLASVGLHNGTPKNLWVKKGAFVALIHHGVQGKIGMARRGQNVVLLGRELRDAREEMFCRMVCDGLALGVAYARAGFTSKDHNAPSMLFALPRVQERANAILEARRTTGVVTLAEVTDMLQRVFAGAHAKEEYSAAHNAAFSLARLYGHVTDKATLEVIRKPSRDPDAPSEQALSSWVQSLPALPAPGPASPSFGAQGPGPLVDGDLVRADYAPASPDSQGLEPQPQSPNDINGLDPSGLTDRYALTAGPGPSGPELSNDIKGLDWIGTRVGGRPENGAPDVAVTGTPNSGAQSSLLGPSSSGDEKTGTPRHGGSEKGAPSPEKQVPGTPKTAKKRRLPDRQVPSFKDLFG